MSQVIEKPATRRQQTIPLSRLHTQPGFNPRSTRDKQKYAQLAASVKLKGVLQPILVAPHPEIEGEYVIVAGESRYLAAADASLMEVPCIISTLDTETGGLDDALVENMIRADLSPLDEARGFKRLLEAGLNVKGIAARLSRAPRFVRERLQLLVLPEAVQRQVDAGTVPLSVVPALARLAEIHAGLPEVAVAKAGRAPDQRHFSYYQPSWKDLEEDPIGVVLADGYTVELPGDVYSGGDSYPLARFTLSEKAQRSREKLLTLLDAAPEDLTVRFGRKLVEQAISLKAAHVGKNTHVLIVGQDVADQLAGDAIGLMLAEARRHDRATRAWHEQARGASAAGTGGATLPQDEAQRNAQAAAQREQDKKDRQHALAHNDALGTAVMQSVMKIKVDVRVLKILAAVNLGGDLGKIAARGARYCLPYEYWKQSRKLKSGATMTEMVDAAHCRAPARTWLEGARGMADYAGRLLSLLVLARLADERAMPRSRRAFYELAAGHDLPWSGEVIELVDEIAAELLPEHLTAPVLKPAREHREREQAARLTLERALADPSALSEDERKAALEAARTVHGWDPAYYEVAKQLKKPPATAQDEASSPTASLKQAARVEPEPIDPEERDGDPADDSEVLEVAEAA